MSRRTSTAATPARTLADALRGWSDDALVSLLRTRPDLGRPAPADISSLAARAAGRGSVALLLDRLDTAQVSVVEALALLPQPVATSDVERIVNATPATVASVLARLRALALVWGEDEDLRLVRAAHDVVGSAPAGLGPSLTTLLTATPANRLHALGEDLGLAVAGQPAAMAARIAEAFADRAWTQARIDEAVAAAGDDVTRILQRLTAGLPTGRLGQVPTDVRLATASDALEHLLARGLVLPVDAQTVTLPQEVGLALRGGRTTASSVDAAPVPSTSRVEPALVDRIGAGAAFESVRRVELVLETWGERPPAVLRSGGLGVRDVRAVAAELDVDADEAGFLLEVALAAGLLAVGDDPELDEAWLPTEDSDVWRGQPVADRWERMARAWLATPRAMLLVGGRDERGRPVNALTPDLERGGVVAVRRAALGVLARAEPGAAVEDVGEVVAAVEWLRPRRAVLRDDIVRRSLLEATWLGVTAAGALTTPGRRLLDGRGSGAALAPLLPEPVGHVLLQADLTAVAPGPLEARVAHGLALLADVESRGGATVYRFSVDSLRRALDAGWPVAEVHAFLEAHSRTPVPQPLTYLVDDTARRHGRLRVGSASVYVRADDPTELDALMADPLLRTLGLRRVAPTVAMTELPPDVVLARLRRAHHAPLLEGADGRTVGVTAASRRARPGSGRRRTPAEAVGMDANLAKAVVGAVRAGERARSARPSGERTQTATQLVDELRAAAEDGTSVWLAYLDETGTVSERVVDPMGVDGGRLTAYDHRSAGKRTFSLHRISYVAVEG